MKVKSIFLILFVFSIIQEVSAQQSCGTVKDIDGNEYKTVKIGTQCWMAENFKVTKYQDSTRIPLVTEDTDWANLANNKTDDAYCFYSDNSGDEASSFCLYTWAAAMGDNAMSSNYNLSRVQGICPNGWHLPSDKEWSELTDFLGGEGVAGERMKETGTKYWISPNIANNKSGFSALPGGRDGSTGEIDNQGMGGYFWSSTEASNMGAWARIIGYNITEVYRYNNFKSFGFSVRCIKN